mmetsp:Transcript_179861/g.437636  ORF Transcript_179861/g.437636 Transcript_179861/m.437636 type:complete len:396 (-) Transcript_179861:241-1428(-)
MLRPEQPYEEVSHSSEATLRNLASSIRVGQRREHPLTFGVLSTAGINEAAIISPVKKNPGVASITAIASRDPARCREYTTAYGLQDARIFNSYQELLDQSEVEAVYIPLPNGLHYEWTMKALRAGKHVLCEKPFASNAEEARAMVQLAREKNLVLMEAFHNHYHPFAKRVHDIAQSGIVGEIRHVHARFVMNTYPFGELIDLHTAAEIRWNQKLAGGTFMDLGSYTVEVLLDIMDRETPIVTSAQAIPWGKDPAIDKALWANLTFPRSKVDGSVMCSFAGPESYDSSVLVSGSKGTIRASNFNQPHQGNKILVTDLKGEVLLDEDVQALDGATTYDLQLEAFVHNVRQVKLGQAKADQFANTGAEPVVQMELVDRIYKAAGMEPRTGPANIIPKY